MTFDELPTVDRSNRPLELSNAIIKSVSISNDDHGQLTAWLHLQFDCGECGFGGYALGKADGDNLSAPGNYAGEFLVRCINTVMVDGYGKWEKLAGEPVRCLHEGLGGVIVAIGNFIKDKWFCPRIEFERQPMTNLTLVQLRDFAAEHAGETFDIADPLF